VLVVPAFNWPEPVYPSTAAVNALMAATAARLGRMSHGALSYDWVIGDLVEMMPDPDEPNYDEDENLYLVCAGERPNADYGLGDMAEQSLQAADPPLPYTVADFDLIIFYWPYQETCANYSVNGAQQGGGVWYGRSWHRPDGRLVWINGHDDLTWTRLVALAEGVRATDGLYCRAEGAVAPPDSCEPAFRSNPFDLMNPAAPYVAGRAHPPVTTKARLGWLPDSSIAVPRVEQWSEFRLAPMEADSGLRAVRIPTRSEEEFWIEYRRPIGDDQHLGAWPNVGRGVQVYWVPYQGAAARLLDFGTGTKGTDIGSFRDATLPVGQDWFQESGIAIRVIAAGPDGATVAVFRPGHRPGPSGVTIDGNPSTGHVRVSWTPPDTPAPLTGYEVRFEARSQTSPTAHAPLTETIVLGPEETTTDVSVTYPMLPSYLRAQVTALYDAPGPRDATSEVQRGVGISVRVEPVEAWEPGDQQIEFEASHQFSDPLLQAPNGPAFLLAYPEGLSYGPVNVPGRVAVPVHRSGRFSLGVVLTWQVGSIVFAGNGGQSAPVMISGGAGSFDRPLVEYEPSVERTTVSWSPAPDPSVRRYRVQWSDLLVGHGWSEVDSPVTSLEIPGGREGVLAVVVTALDEHGRILASSASTEVLTETTPVVDITPAHLPEGPDGPRTVDLEVALASPAVTRGTRLVELTGPQCKGFAFVFVGPSTSRLTVPVTITGDSRPGPGSTCHAYSRPLIGGETRLLGVVQVVDDD
jgi:hypothetical protein